jgi:hypothetical protein
MLPLLLLRVSQLLCSTIESNKVYITQLEADNEELHQQLQKWEVS